VWGIIHGLCLVLERVLRAVFKDAAWTTNPGVQILLGLATYAVVCIAWVFFRATDFPTAARLVSAMAGLLPRGDAILSTREILQVAVVTAGLLGAHWLLRNTTMEAVVTKSPRWLLASVWTVMVCGTLLTQGNGNAFIYFQF
jgi:alginate O-acetyltransferase complex protein AlgI